MSASDLNVLLVDDDDAVRITAETMLRPLGATVRHAADGVQALALTREREPDVILLDLMMPRMNGYQFLRALRDAESTVPVIVVSGKSDALDRFWAARLQVHEFVQKPFTPERIREAIESALSGELVT